MQIVFETEDQKIELMLFSFLGLPRFVVLFRKGKKGKDDWPSMCGWRIADRPISLPKISNLHLEYSLAINRASAVCRVWEGWNPFLLLIQYSNRKRSRSRRKIGFFSCNFKFSCLRVDVWHKQPNKNQPFYLIYSDSLDKKRLLIIQTA